MKRRFTRAGPVYIFLCVGISQIKHVPQSLLFPLYAYLVFYIWREKPRIDASTSLVSFGNERDHKTR
jgi:hypothetical protein